MNNKRGEYVLSEDAYDYYKLWYRQEILDLRDKASRGEIDHRDNRKTQHVLKLALVMALQRYAVDHYITVEDLEYAIKILEYVNGSSMDMIEDISITGQQDGRMYKFQRIIRTAGKEGIERVKLSKNHNFKKAEIDKYLEELESRELIYQDDKVVVGENGRKRNAKVLYYMEKTK